MGAMLLGAVLLHAVGCTYGPEEGRATLPQVVPLGDSYRALVVVEHERFRPPTGLSTFPDGGRRRHLARRARVVLIHARERTAEPFPWQAAPDSVWESFHLGVRGVEGDTVAYLAMTGCPRGGQCPPGLRATLAFRLSTAGGLRRIPDLPADTDLPGTMLARRSGEERYVRYRVRAGTLEARFRVDGAYSPLFRVGPDGSLRPATEG